jgi:hypothetical protein
MSPDTLLRAHRTLAAVIAALILVMAAIAGRALFGPWDIEVHGFVGNGVFVLAVANLALAIYRRPGNAQLTVAALVGMLTFAQVGLGYVGREELEAAAWHIPNGVLLMALSTYQWATLQARVAGSAAA